MKTVEEIKKAYEIVKPIVIGEGFNDKETRKKTKGLLEVLLGDKIDRVKCDEENNPPNVIDENILIAHVVYKDKKRFIDLTFGKEVVWEHEIE